MSALERMQQRGGERGAERGGDQRPTERKRLVLTSSAKGGTSGQSNQVRERKVE